jgi:hypothetical protein
MAEPPDPGNPLRVNGFGPSGKFWLTLPAKSVTYPPMVERPG